MKIPFLGEYIVQSDNDKNGEKCYIVQLAKGQYILWSRSEQDIKKWLNKKGHLNTELSGLTITIDKRFGTISTQDMEFISSAVFPRIKTVKDVVVPFKQNYYKIA